MNFSKIIICSLLLSFAVTSTTGCEKLRPNKYIYKSGLQADKIIVNKSKNELLLLKNGKVIREYNARFGDVPVGHKQFEGDEKTPEGDYYIQHKNPNSKFFLSLLISYPNEQDEAYAEQFGKSAGSHIMIHGQPNRSTMVDRIKNDYRDWTDGCIAVDDKDMIEIYAMVQNGVPITINP